MSSEAVFQAEYFLKFMPREGALFNKDVISEMFVEGPTSWSPEPNMVKGEIATW